MIGFPHRTFINEFFRGATLIAVLVTVIIDMQAQNSDYEREISLQGVARGLCIQKEILYSTAGNTIVKCDFKSAPQTIIKGLNTPFDVDVDEAGNIYVANRGGKNVEVYSANGVSRYALQIGENVNGVTMGPDGKLYVASLTKISVYRENTLENTIISLTKDKFREVRKVYFDSAGRMYIIDKNTGMIALSGVSGETATVDFIIKKDSRYAYNSLAYMTSLPDGSLLITSDTDFKGGLLGVYRFDLSGNFKNTIGELGSGKSFTSPYGIAADSNGRLFIADGNKIQVWKVTDNEPPVVSDIKISNITRSSVDFSLTSSESGNVYWEIRNDGVQPTADELLNGTRSFSCQANQETIQTLHSPSGSTLRLYFIVRDKAGNTTKVLSGSEFSTLQPLAINYIVPVKKDTDSVTFEVSANDEGTLYYLLKPDDGSCQIPTSDAILQGNSREYPVAGKPLSLDVSLPSTGRYWLYALIQTSGGENSGVYTCTVTSYSDIDLIRKRYIDLLIGDDTTDYSNLSAIDRYNSLLTRFSQASDMAGKYDPDVPDLPEFVLDEKVPGNDIALVRELVGKVLFPLAMAYRLKGPDTQPNIYYHNAGILSEIMKLYKYLSVRNFKTGRELHFTGGGVYLRLTGYFYASMLMREELAKAGMLDEVSDMMEWATRWVVPNSVDIEGGEEDWSASAAGNISRSDGVRTIYNNRLMYILTAGDNVADREEKLSYLTEVLNQAFVPHGAWDGFLKPDYTGYHHLGVWGSAYVTDALQVASQMAFLLHNTVYGIATDPVKHIAEGLKAFGQYSGKYDISRGLCGRFPGHLNDIINQIPAYAYIYYILPEGKLKKEIGGVFANLYDTEYNPVQTGMIRNTACEIIFTGGMGTINICNGLKAVIVPVKEMELNRTFPYAAMQIHRRSDWLATIKGYSKYVWDFETNGSENWYGRNQSFGQLSIYSGKDSEGVVSALASGVGYDGYDWSHIPGTTVPDLSLPEVLADAKAFEWPRFSNEAFAGGVSDGRNGVYGFKFSDRTKGQSSASWTKPKLTALKSYFFFDDLIVALGSDIDNTASDYAAHTTIFQNLLPSPETPTIVNGTQITGLSYVYDQNVESPVYLTDIAGNGYYIPDAKGLHIHRNVQQSVDDKNKNATSGNYATAWINHGRKTKNGGYEYVVWVRGASFISGLANDPDSFYSVLRRDKVAHIVKRGQEKGLSVFASDTLVGDEIISSVSEPCNIWLTSGTDRTILTVSNPDLGYYKKGNEFGCFPVQAWSVPKSKRYMDTKIQPVEITLNGKWNIADASGKVEFIGYNEMENTTILKFNGTGGESVSVPLIYTGSGMENVDTDDRLCVYPNPTSGKLYIRSYEPVNTIIRITDIGGRQVMSVKTNRGETNVCIDLTGFSAGYYFLIADKTIKRILKK
ncbi:polysaccharide lyase family 8 super-sandwich domain-containing protein [Coprobacter tertius]|uniref:T9SS type A sorting domain-containing protein n=1 Tax=Coprobacter tertius TaxID=2944915 RepID=A0ABT1MF59_9BACT|nr:polysaccharide lyase family 8 super-sandwich domain-containing protein [Coprobacter tertius]MCP9610979.1 T9SS type A sorting domain-containing protein [Coprobacter tertius]